MDREVMGRLVEMDVRKLVRVVHYALTTLRKSSPPELPTDEIAEAKRILASIARKGDQEDAMRSLNQLVQERGKKELSLDDEVAQRGLARLRRVEVPVP
jgi:hypothetical protein